MVKVLEVKLEALIKDGEEKNAKQIKAIETAIFKLTGKMVVRGKVVQSPIGPKGGTADQAMINEQQKGVADSAMRQRLNKNAYDPSPDGEPAPEGAKPNFSATPNVDTGDVRDKQPPATQNDNNNNVDIAEQYNKLINEIFGSDESRAAMSIKSAIERRGQKALSQELEARRHRPARAPRRLIPALLILPKVQDKRKTIYSFDSWTVSCILIVEGDSWSAFKIRRCAFGPGGLVEHDGRSVGADRQEVAGGWGCAGETKAGEEIQNAQGHPSRTTQTDAAQERPAIEDEARR